MAVLRALGETTLTPTLGTRSTGLMAAFARYGEEEFDAVQRIIDLSRD